MHVALSSHDLNCKMFMLFHCHWPDLRLPAVLQNSLAYTQSKHLFKIFLETFLVVRLTLMHTVQLSYQIYEWHLTKDNMNFQYSDVTLLSSLNVSEDSGRL